MSDWGKGVNNDIGWGQGANNDIGWGSIYDKSNAGETLLSGGGGFNPSNLFSNGEEGVWYDPSDLSTLFQDAVGTVPVTANGDPVGKMLDKSGNANHAFQSVSGNRPVYNGLSYNGVDDFLDTGKTSFGNTSLFADSSEEFYVAVVANISFSNDGTVIAKGGSGTAQRNFQIYFQDNLSSPSIVIRGNKYETNWSLDDGQDHVIWANWDGSQMTVGYDDNDAIIIPVGSATLETTQRIIIGARTNGEGFHFEGKIGGVVIRDKSLTVEEKSETASFLLNKGIL